MFTPVLPNVSLFTVYLRETVLCPTSVLQRVRVYHENAEFVYLQRRRHVCFTESTFLNSVHGIPADRATFEILLIEITARVTRAFVLKRSAPERIRTRLSTISESFFFFLPRKRIRFRVTPLIRTNTTHYGVSVAYLDLNSGMGGG